MFPSLHFIFLFNKERRVDELRVDERATLNHTLHVARSANCARLSYFVSACRTELLVVRLLKKSGRRFHGSVLGRPHSWITSLSLWMPRMWSIARARYYWHTRVCHSLAFTAACFITRVTHIYARASIRLHFRVKPCTQARVHHAESSTRVFSRRIHLCVVRAFFIAARLFAQPLLNERAW